MSAFIWRGNVQSGWVDYNGHMGDFAYAIAFSQTVTAFMDVLGLDAAYRAQTGATLYTLEMRIGYQRECHEGDSLEIRLHIRQADSRRLHLYLEMVDARGAALAWNEQVLMHVSRSGPRPKAAPFLPRTAQRIRELMACTAPSETSRQPRLNRTSMHSATCSIWSREMKQKVSGKTGPIQNNIDPEA
jgi:acyl-CoA thioester hydrolase